MIKTMFLCFLLATIVLASCKSDSSVKESYALDGNWKIYEAYRNNELTTTLEDGYFEFIDSSMETNILGDPISGVYRLDDHKFIHKSELPATYQITQYSSDSMQLNTEIKGFRFKFMLRKSIDSIPAN